MTICEVDGDGDCDGMVKWLNAGYGLFGIVLSMYLMFSALYLVITDETSPFIRVGAGMGAAVYAEWQFKRALGKE